MRKIVMARGMQLVVSLAHKRLRSSLLLLSSDNPYDAFILYSFAFEEFGKALFIKDCIDNDYDGLPVWLFKERVAHIRKMTRAKQYLPVGCSEFTPMVTLLQPNDKIETVNYNIWHGKDVETRTVSRPAMTSGGFADVTNVTSDFDEITREELLYVNYDPRTKKWHTNPDYSIHELEAAITLLDQNLISFAAQNSIKLAFEWTKISKKIFRNLKVSAKPGADLRPG